MKVKIPWQHTDPYSWEMSLQPSTPFFHPIHKDLTKSATLFPMKSSTNAFMRCLMRDCVKPLLPFLGKLILQIENYLPYLKLLYQSFEVTPEMKGFCYIYPQGLLWDIMNQKTKRKSIILNAYGRFWPLVSLKGICCAIIFIDRQWPQLQTNEKHSRFLLMKLFLSRISERW